MKSFFEEYGFVALAAIVVVILIAMATPVGTAIRNYVMNFVNKFGNSSEGWLDQMNAIGANLTNDLTH